MVQKDMLVDCQAQKVKVNTWTLNDEELIKQMLAVGVEGIITDDPKLAIRLKNDLQVTG